MLPYMASLHGGFVYDDHILVEAAGSTPSAWEDFLHGGLWRDLPAAGYYRPVLTLSFALDRFLGGGRPFVFHLTNLVLHLLLVLTGWRLLERYPPTRRLALAASVLFAVHPLHVEAVAWISGRGDLLAPLLGLLAWHAYLKGGWSGGRLAPPSRLWLMAAGLLFLLALLSKESAVALPGLVLLPLLAVWPGREKGKSPSQIWPAGVMVLVLVLALTLRLAALSGFRGAYGVDPLENPAAGLALPDRLATSAGAFITGLRLLIWPAHLTFDYGPPVLGPLHLATTDGVLSVAGFLGVVLLTVLVLLLGSRGRPTFLPLGYGLGWMLMAWLPVSSLGPLPGTLLGERFLLFPSWGWTVMVAALLAGLSRLFPQGGRGSVWGAAISRLFLIGLLLCFATLSSLRVPDWRSDQALLNAALAASPVSHRVHFFQGLRLYRRGRMADARQAFAACLAAAPTFSRAHEALARTFLRLGDRA
ncbi:MAG: hypothetical protein ACE5ID_09155, partial [Acidobacteriota bacterium]